MCHGRLGGGIHKNTMPPCLKEDLISKNGCEDEKVEVTASEIQPCLLSLVSALLITAALIQNSYFSTTSKPHFTQCLPHQAAICERSAIPLKFHYTKQLLCCAVLICQDPQATEVMQHVYLLLGIYRKGTWPGAGGGRLRDESNCTCNTGGRGSVTLISSVVVINMKSSLAETS